MALTLTPGSESRLDGAPDLALPGYADFVDSVARKLVDMDPDGSLYGGDPKNAMPDAEKWAADYVQGQRKGIAANRTAADGRAQKAADGRAARSAATRGVSPESLPADAYGAASGRTVQEANRPVPEAEAALAMEQDAADRIVRGLREGTPTFEAQGDLDFLRERGDMNPLAGAGRTDMAMRGRIRERRGQSFEMPDGSRIPVGREPTAAEIRSEREWQDWANETPGTERQALYDPAGYEQFREGVRNDIRDSARQDMATYGTGTDDPEARVRLGLPALTPEQEAARANRKESESAVLKSQRGKFYRQRLEADAGMTAEQAKGKTDDELRAAAYKQRYSARQRELATRKQNRIDQAMLAGGQPTGGPGGTRATTTAINQLGPGWREIALLDRLTNGRIGGPTPLGVDAMGAQNALRFLNNEAIAGMDPLRRAAAQAQMDMQQRQNAPDIAAQKDIATGNTQTPEAVAHLDELADRLDTTWGGYSYENESLLAQTLQRPPYNLPQPDAEALAYRMAERRRWFTGRSPGGGVAGD